MTPRDKINLTTIADNYGKEKQVDIAIEECSELIKALLKDRRGKATIDDIVDEIADVQIMPYQLEYLFKCENAVNERVRAKIARQLSRIKEENAKV